MQSENKTLEFFQKKIISLSNNFATVLYTSYDVLRPSSLRKKKIALSQRLNIKNQRIIKEVSS